MYFSCRSKVHIVLFLLLIVLSLSYALILSKGGEVHAASPVITLSPNSGPPTTNVTVKGVGFGINETITINFDTSETGTATADSKGVFKATIIVSSSASLGKHIVQAIGQISRYSAQAKFLVQAKWPMFGFGPEHINYNPYENILNSTNVSGLVQEWTGTTGRGITSSPAIVNGVVYIGSDKMYAFNANTGKLLWATSTGGPIAFSSPAIVNDVVYVGSIDNNLYAFNARTGAILWTAVTGGSISYSPVVANGTVYINSSDGNLYAFNAKTGKAIWITPLGPIFNSSPAVANGVVYLGAENRILYALNAKTGIILWSTTIDLFIDSSPSVANGIVYVGTGNNAGYATISAFDASTGALLWSLGVGEYIYSAPTLVGQIAYIGDNEGVLALDTTTHNLLWHTLSGSFVDASPTLANGVIYIHAGSNLYALNASSGNTLWTFPMTAQQTYPIVVNGQVFMGSNDNTLYTFYLPSSLSN